jgi:diphthamide biosynthesis protein 7
MDDAKIIFSDVSLTLGLPPSCIQFCPAHPDLFVVGTYNLEKNEDNVQEGKDDGDDDDDDDEHLTATKTPQSRNGSLLVFKVDGTKL